MKIISSYNKKWLIYILSLFLFFTSVLLFSEYFHEKSIRIDALNKELNNYTGIVHRYALQYHMHETDGFTGLDTLGALIANHALRITIIDFGGKVLYDSEVKNPREMENHLQRPEIQMAITSGFGTGIRVSATTNIKYYYYAKRYSDYIIRVSIVYDINAKRFIQPDRIFLLFTVFFFFITSFIIVLITDKFGKSISTLREFTLKALANKPIDEKLVFPENELGVIGQDIIDIYQHLNRTKEELLSEKAKLIRHLNMLDEGIAIFTKDRHTITSNNNFIRFINHISDTRVFTADEFFRIADFNPIFSFIHKYLKDDQADLLDLQPTYEITLNKNGKFFSVKSIVFQDKSFEISVNDITKPTKRKVLKQQITENIAHELKTPVSSIKGFLETMLHSHTDKARMTDYLTRAYVQSCRLADLINDISMLTKIEEAASLYHIEQVNLEELVRDIAGEIQHAIEENRIALELKISENLIVEGNQGLLYSVFRNLFDNAINHGGTGLTIRVDNYMQDNHYHYFSFSDTGTGVPDEDLPRLFERFYRVDKGRDRKKGGTGLGLAIVKNAIQFHKGEITVKNRLGGGLEFLFTLAKDLKAGTRDK
jgi:two-component system, OmpR family, phosphate regulon sensor histidine kinase PhoR